MKRVFFPVLSLLLALTACGGGAKEDFVWSREGYFGDENGNSLYVMASPYPEEYPGWYVGGTLDEIFVGSYIQQEGTALHGNLVFEDSGEDPVIATVTEEGEDGLMVVVENGSTYHFTSQEIPTASIVVTVNTEGFGQIATAKAGETPAFSDEYPTQSAYLGLEGPETYVFAAKPDEGCQFIQWTRDGEPFSTEEQITVELTESAEYVAVFSYGQTGP